jgi:hypothetical protein
VKSVVTLWSSVTYQSIASIELCAIQSSAIFKNVFRLVSISITSSKYICLFPVNLAIEFKV